MNQILKSKNFLALFTVQFFGALNDNIFKNSFIILLTFVIASKSNTNIGILLSAIAALFICPFFFFSGLSGQIASKFQKKSLIIIIKAVEIILMITAIIGFYLKSLPILLTITFLTGLQSTFFGPIKYSILPNLVKPHQLVSANGLINSATFLAILLGTIFATITITTNSGIAIISIIIILASLIGFSASFYIDKTAINNQNQKINPNILASTLNLLKLAKQDRNIYLTILGISWFWFIGASFLTQLPNFTKAIIGGNESLVAMFLSIFAISIALGSYTINKLLRGQILAIYTPISAILVSIFTIDFAFALNNAALITQQFNISNFFASFNNLRIATDFFAIGFFSAIYVIPLYAILQNNSPDQQRCNIIASLNIYDALLMTLSAITIAILLKITLSLSAIFIIMALFNLIVAFIIAKTIPGSLLKSIFRSFFIYFYKVQVKNFQNYQKIKENCLIIANHTSFLDAALLVCFLPDKLTFAINTQIAKKFWIKPFLKLVDAHPIDPTNPMATKILIDLVNQGKKVVIFPEGRITVTGSLMKIYEGTALIADKSSSQILPIRIDGAEISKLSRLKGKFNLKLFPKVTLNILEPQKLQTDPKLNPRQRKAQASQKLYDLMTNMLFITSNYQTTLFEDLIHASNIHGKNQKIIEDINFRPLSYANLFTKSFALALKFKKITKDGENIGLMLANSAAVAVSFFSLQAVNRVPAMLNFSLGANSIISCAKTAKIKTIITAKKFIQEGGFEQLINELEKQKFTIIYLEDIAQEIAVKQKITAYLSSFFPLRTFKKLNKKVIKSSNPAVILFTSGSEGAPKGVVLTHQNILANKYQLAAKIDFSPKDIIFNILPMFHSFGLTAGTLLPILNGIKTFLYPTPLHYKIIPELVYSTNATIIFGTNSFFASYAKYAHAYDFYNLRYAFAGAEKLQETTYQTWLDKFGVRIFEGYGAAECSPVISLNTPIENKRHSVGKALPGITTKLQEVPGIEGAGKLIISGDNVMLGYLLAENPGKIKYTQDATYDTGDIVNIDDEGFIFIKGRAKRFAKIAGEMVSLTYVENYINKIYSNSNNAVIAIPCPKKGEELIYFTDNKAANLEDLTNYASKNDISNLQVPKKLKIINEIPMLATGKIDYPALLA